MEKQDYVSYIRSRVGHDKIIMTAACAIIEKDGKILLQHRSDNGKWGIPGGIMEMGESVREGAMREVREETGLDISLDWLIGVYHNFDCVFSSGDEAHVINFIFKATPLKGEPRTDHESLELRYFSKDELPEIYSPDIREAIADYYSGVKGRII